MAFPAAAAAAADGESFEDYVRRRGLTDAEVWFACALRAVAADAALAEASEETRA